MKKLKKTLITAGIVVAGSAAAIHMINKLISASSVVKNLLNPESKNYYKWRYGNIYYTKQGSGSPLLLIHDLQCSSCGYEWNQIIDELSKDHTVYTIDLLGCGRSDKPSITYTNYLYVQLITDFVNKIVKEPVDIIATGLSASIAVTACNQDTDVFNKIMLINPEDLAVLNQIPKKRSKMAKAILELPIIGTMIFHMVYAKSNIELLFTERWLYNPFHTNNKDIDTYYEAAHRGKGNGKYLLSSIVGNYAYFNIAHSLKAIDNSIFIIGGEKEAGIAETISMYTALNTSIESVVLPKVKHLPQLEAPESLLEQIKIYI